MAPENLLKFYKKTPVAYVRHGSADLVEKVQ